MPIQSTRVLFETLFARTDPKTQERLLAHKKSVLDGSLEQAKSLMDRVSGRDRQRLEEYFAALRESEQELTSRLSGSANRAMMSNSRLPPSLKTVFSRPMSTRNGFSITPARFNAELPST